MASVVTFRVSPSSAINLEYKPRFRVRTQSLGDGDSSVLSSDSVVVNGGSVTREKVKDGTLVHSGNGRIKPRIEEKKLVKDAVSEDLEVLWEDGYGTKSVKDYLDEAKEMVKPDGGPPRWFCPVDCGPPLEGSPTLLFLPGLDGLGLGLILHQKPLGKAFEVQCLHIPVYDRTPFEGLYFPKPVKSSLINKCTLFSSLQLNGCIKPSI
ncbi:hypothetical protein Patl1_23395 [Pistacia atlantica]|uniref:Uncharacterized protein n=1 Tax=Pistacia atlantica TaxID=434234 RepID=A0ACC0ZUS5_9ROSI|nr:hypothetical protein Patl1_23395 [Pistacia atlantica]